MRKRHYKKAVLMEFEPKGYATLEQKETGRLVLLYYNTWFAKKKNWKAIHRVCDSVKAR